jgi:hypothetical protein
MASESSKDGHGDELYVPRDDPVHPLGEGPRRRRRRRSRSLRGARLADEDPPFRDGRAPAHCDSRGGARGVGGLAARGSSCLASLSVNSASIPPANCGYRSRAVTSPAGT